MPPPPPHIHIYLDNHPLVGQVQNWIVVPVILFDMMENYIKYSILFHSIWGVHDFTHSLYIHYMLLKVSVLALCLRINDSGLFAWISLTALSRTYFIRSRKMKTLVYQACFFMLSLEMLYTYIVHDCDIVYI